MKEILYIQAGNVSNHIGTHFWNTQESYFTYGDDQDDFVTESLVNHDVSFREGLSTQASLLIKYMSSCLRTVLIGVGLTTRMRLLSARERL